jgi:hypothetical protein
VAAYLPGAQQIIVVPPRRVLEAMRDSRTIGRDIS